MNFRTNLTGSWRNAAAALALGAVVAGAALAAACGDDSEQTVHVGATEYAFDAPAHLKAGEKHFVVDNAGGAAHEMFLLKVNDGYTIEQVMEAQGEEGTATNYGAVFVDPQSHAPAAMNVTLEKGTYMLICGLPALDGEPHALKGMVHNLEVS